MYTSQKQIALSQNVKRLRRTIGLTRDELSTQVGVSKYKINQLESGKPTLLLWSHMVNLSKTLHVPVEALYVADERVVEKIQQIVQLLETGGDLLKGEQLCSDIFDENGHDTLVRIITFNLLGKLFYAGGKFQKAYDVFLVMIHEMNMCQDFALQYAAHLNIALSCFYLRKYEQAIAWLDQLETSSVQHLIGTEDNLKVAHLRVNIYIETAKYELATERALDVLSAYKLLNRTKEELEMLHNLGYIYMKQKDFTQALHYLALVKAKAILLKNNRLLCKVGEDLSECYLQMQEPEKAQQVILSVIPHVPDDFLQVKLRLNLARCKSDRVERLHSLQEVYDEMQQMDNPKLVRDIAKYLGQAYKEIGDTVKAVHYYETALQLSEHLEMN